jgi:hypothetical protein
MIRENLCFLLVLAMSVMMCVEVYVSFLLPVCDAHTRCGIQTHKAKPSVTLSLAAAACTLLQGEQVLVDGIGRASEVEEVLPDPAAARRFLQQPSELLALRSDIMTGLAQ